MNKNIQKKKENIDLYQDEKVKQYYEEEQANLYCEEATPSDLIKEIENRLYRVPVFLSKLNTVTPIQQQFLERLIQELRRELLFPRSLPFSEQYPELILTSVRRMVLSSYGLIAVNLRSFKVTVTQFNTGGPLQNPIVEWLGTPFSQIEPAMAYQHGLPILLIREKGVGDRGIWENGIGPFFILEWDSKFEQSLSEQVQSITDFFNSVIWREAFQNWAGHVRSGYYLNTQPDFQYTCANPDQ